MVKKEDKILDSLEWEDFNFPLNLTNISLKNGFYKLRNDTQIKIWRNDEFKLIGEIEGIVSHISDLDYDSGETLKKGAFVKGETIICNNNLTDKYLLKQCLIFSNHTTKQIDGEFHFKAKLKLEAVEKEFDKDENTHSIIDWHLCSFPNFIFPRMTTRINNYPFKCRDGIDKKLVIKSNNDFRGLTRDFIVLQLSNNNIILQNISKDYLPDWASGIAIEYRSDISQLLDSETREAIAEFVEFIFGIQLFAVGSTYFNSKISSIASVCFSPFGNNIISGCGANPMPPIDINIEFENTLSHLLNNYLLLRDKYKLKDVLWKLKLGKEQALGTNLPILASGIETLADEYISEKEIIKKYSKTEKKQYRTLIKDEFEKLSDKIKKYQFGSFILNKLNNPFHFGIGEKTKLFFDALEFKIEEDSVESEAILARNKMVHSSMANLSETKALEFTRYTNAYITLYNRIILKILGYVGEYIDYYTFGFPEKNINENIETEK